MGNNCNEYKIREKQKWMKKSKQNDKKKTQQRKTKTEKK